MWITPHTMPSLCLCITATAQDWTTDGVVTALVQNSTSGEVVVTCSATHLSQFSVVEGAAPPVSGDMDGDGVVLGLVIAAAVFAVIVGALLVAAAVRKQSKQKDKPADPVPVNSEPQVIGVQDGTTDPNASPSAVVPQTSEGRDLADAGELPEDPNDNKHDSDDDEDTVLTSDLPGHHEEGLDAMMVAKPNVFESARPTGDVRAGASAPPMAYTSPVAPQPMERAAHVVPRQSQAHKQPRRTSSDSERPNTAAALPVDAKDVGAQVFETDGSEQDVPPGTSAPSGSETGSYTGSSYTGSDSGSYTGSSYTGSSYTGSSYTGSDSGSYTGSSYTGSSYTGSSYTGSSRSGSGSGSDSEDDARSPRRPVEL